MNKKTYVKEVLQNVQTNRKNKSRIKEDLSAQIDEMMERDPYCNLVEELGTPHDFAYDLMDGFDEEEQILKAGWKPYEYKSKLTIFGLPLVHIRTGGRYGSGVAKGIIAIGDIAMGVLSIGGVSVGVFSLGGVSIGLLALGGVAIGGAAAGGVALGLYAFGAVAIGIIQMFGAITG